MDGTYSNMFIIKLLLTIARKKEKCNNFHSINRADVGDIRVTIELLAAKVVYVKFF